MTILILGLVLFLGIHSVRILAAPLRGAQIAASEKRWRGLYSLIAGLGFVLIILGWIKFRPLAPQLYDPPAWGRHATMGLVWLAFVAMTLMITPDIGWSWRFAAVAVLTGPIGGVLVWWRITRGGVPYHGKAAKA